MDNAAAAFVDQPIAEGLGDETALVTAARPVTYAELSALVDRAGHALRARGVEPEQRVALLLPDGIGFAAAFFAAIKIGAVPVPLNTRLSSGDLHVIYLHPAWADPASAASVMQRYRPTLLFSVPTFYAALLRAALPPDIFASVRACVSAGERLPAEIYEAWRARFGVEILDGMGATETVFMVLSNRPGASRPGSTGVPVPGTEAELRDAAGHVVADGEPGVLWVRTPSAAMGYYKRLDQSRRTFVGAWLRTGDVYRRDGDGFYEHCGREDDGFKVAGQWVMPGELESVARRHPDVLDAGAVGAEDAGGLVKPFVFVVPRDSRAAPADLEAGLRGLLEASLPRHQWPRAIIVVPDLPRTDTGKLQRFRLRDQVLQDRVLQDRVRQRGDNDA